MQIKAAIFDLDGTLLDSLEDLADSMNTVLQNLNCPTHPLEAYRFFVGKGIRHLAEKCLPADQMHLLEQAVEDMRSHYKKNSMNKSRWYPGIVNLLSFCKKQKLLLAVLSNKPHEMTSAICHHLSEPGTFDHVLGFSERFPIKPDPSSALHLAEEMNVPTEQIAYLGDTDVDMQTACSAGMIPFGVSWGFRPRTELLEHGARFILDSPEDFYQYL